MSDEIPPGRHDSGAQRYHAGREPLPPTGATMPAPPDVCLHWLAEAAVTHLPPTIELPPRPPSSSRAKNSMQPVLRLPVMPEAAIAATSPIAELPPHLTRPPALSRAIADMSPVTGLPGTAEAASTMLPPTTAVPLP
jgi:hypothetical protein